MDTMARLQSLRTGNDASGAVYTARSVEDKQFLLDQMLSAGAVIQYQDSTQIRVVKPKKFGPAEIFALVFGLFLCVVPGLIWMMMWSNKKPESALIMLQY